jgi:hypothetical protein
MRVTRSLGPPPPIAVWAGPLPRRYGAAVRFPINDHHAPFRHEIGIGEACWALDDFEEEVTLRREYR